MEEILGLFMFYVWIHSAVLVFKKIGETTQYEKFVLWASLVTITLYVWGTLA